MGLRVRRRSALGAVAAVSILTATFFALSSGFASAATCDVSRFVTNGKLDVTSYLQCTSPSASPNPVAPGGTVHFTGGGFASSSTVTIELHSTPVVLGTTTTDDDGDFSYDSVIPTDTPTGSHELLAMGVDQNGNQLTDELAITVTTSGTAASGTLPLTGTNSVQYLGLGLALVALGSAAVWGSRRSRSAVAPASSSTTTSSES